MTLSDKCTCNEGGHRMKTLHEMTTLEAQDLDREALVADNRAYAKALHCMASARRALAVGDRLGAQRWVTAAKVAMGRATDATALPASVEATQAVSEARGTAIPLVEGERKVVATNREHTVHTFMWRDDAIAR